MGVEVIMTKTPTAKDIACFNELNRLGVMNNSAPRWYLRRRKDEIFEKSDYISPVDFWNDYQEWCSKSIQLKLF